MKSDEGNAPVVVFAGTAVQATLVKSLLENAEIDAYLKDEYTGGLAPWQTSAGGSGAVKVFVSSGNLEEARAVVEAYEENLNKE